MFIPEKNRNDELVMNTTINYNGLPSDKEPRQGNEGVVNGEREGTVATLLRVTRTVRPHHEKQHKTEDRRRNERLFMNITVIDFTIMTDG